KATQTKVTVPLQFSHSCVILFGCVQRVIPATTMTDNKHSGPPPPYSSIDGVSPTVVEGVSYGMPQVITSQTQVLTTPVVIIGNTCPTCRAGILQNEFTCCGICLGIFFFPIGLICCFLMQERRCSNCRMSFGNP
ncbi:hypothetical protein OTU49_004107, partial [Cherax quadricarinatus]